MSLLARRMFELYCRTLFRVYCPLTVDGSEHLPRSRFLFCSNHASHMDSGVLMTASGRPFAKCGMVAAKDYFFDGSRARRLGQFMTLVPVDRECKRATLRDYVAACTRFFDGDGEVLIVYPEGTRSTTGRLQAFKRGAAIIAVELGLPIVPAYIRGTHEAWPKGGRLMRPRRLRIAIGPPVAPSEKPATTRERFHAYQDLTRVLSDSVHRLEAATAR